MRECVHCDRVLREDAPSGPGGSDICGACEYRMRRSVRLLWIVRFFRWYVAAGANGSGYTRIEIGRVESK